MRILAIETSCDETGAAVVEKRNGEQSIKVLSNIVASSSDLHAKTGGIIPETASREQAKAIIPVIVQALVESQAGDAEWGAPDERTQRVERVSTSGGGAERQDPQENWRIARDILKDKIDAIAVTHGPGLIGSLLVGVETTKTLSFAFKKPIVPVHHLLAHLFANFIGESSKFEIQNSQLFPFIGLIVSGGHTDLLFFESPSKFKWLGGTRDDAAGEVLDKVGRLLGLPYPAGPEIESRATKIQQPTAKFHSPLINSEDFDFSFSGLKTEISRFITNKHLTEGLTNAICFALQDAIFSVLINKTIRAAKLYNAGYILLGGGVSANQTLMDKFRLQADNIKILAPKKAFATDNAAMIGAHALLDYKPVEWSNITAEPDLYFS